MSGKRCWDARRTDQQLDLALHSIFLLHRAPLPPGEVPPVSKSQAPTQASEETTEEVATAVFVTRGWARPVTTWPDSDGANNLAFEWTLHGGFTIAINGDPPGAGKVSRHTRLIAAVANRR